MFLIDDDWEHATRCKCAGCSPAQPAMWSVYSAMLDMGVPGTMRAMRADGETEREEDDPFLALELMLAAILATSFGSKATEAQAAIEKGLQLPLEVRRVRFALEEAQRIMERPLTREEEYHIAVTLNRIMTKGATDAVSNAPTPPAAVAEPLPALPDNGATAATVAFAGVLAGAISTPRVAVGAGTALEGSPSAALVFDGIYRAAKYYSNKHFNDVILPEITKRIGVLLDGANFTDVPDFSDINQYLSRRLKSVPYWRVVANAAASRAYHYGLLKVGQQRGMLGYRIHAVMDSRTSTICRNLHGQVFWLADAVNLMERVASADIDDVKNLMPWPTTVEGMNTQTLRDLGLMVPPFHGNCRSTIRFVRQ